MNTDSIHPPVPARIAAEHASWTWCVVSAYEPNSVMHRLTSAAGETRYLKITRHGWIPAAHAEAARLRWARAHAPVPHVIEESADDETSWVLTATMPGRDATHPSFRDDVPGLVAVLAQGLREFHRMPVEACPFSFRTADALGVARARLAAGQIDPVRDFHAEHAHLTAAGAVALLERTRPDAEDLVVCHGDYCLPNILIEDGRVTGFVDLGELGVADRWWDLAVATWSLTWNLGPGHEAHFLESYGITPDDQRIAFYRLLYDVVS